MAKPKAGETMVFSWITYKSKAQRDRVNKKVMADPRLAEMMDPDEHAVRPQAHGDGRVQDDRVLLGLEHGSYATILNA